MNYPVFIPIFILLFGVVVVAFRYQQKISAARRRIDRLGSQMIETNCGPIEYIEVGEGYPVLVVHGAMGGFDQGLFLAQNIEAPNTRVICLSRFGYLRAPVPQNASLDTQADAFAGLLDALQIQQAAVFAISAGSTSALRFAARHPQRISALILLSPDAPAPQQNAGAGVVLPPRFVFDTLLRSDFLYWLMITLFKRKIQTSIGLVPKGFPLNPEHQALVDTVQMGDLPVSRRMDGMIFETYTCDDEFKASVTPASPHPLNQIQTPTLVINAADDPISIPKNVRRLAEQIPNARLFIVPEGGHLLFGHIKEVRAEITRFLLSQVAELQSGPVRND